MELLKHNAHDASMADHRDFLALRKDEQIAHLVHHSILKIYEGFSARCGQRWKVFDPLLRIGWIALLYLMPGKSFPVSEADLTQARSLYNWSPKCLRNFAGCKDSTLQITAIDLVDSFVGQVLDEVENLLSAAQINCRIGLAAECSSHIGFSVPYKKKTMRHSHAPQR
jgi:hypothetical protein